MRERELTNKRKVSQDDNFNEDSQRSFSIPFGGNNPLTNKRLSEAQSDSCHQGTHAVKSLQASNGLVVGTPNGNYNLRYWVHLGEPYNRDDYEEHTTGGIRTKKFKKQFMLDRADLTSSDIDYLADVHLSWVREKTSLTFIGNGEILHRRAPKRGNSVYKQKMDKRLDDLVSLLNEAGLSDMTVRKGKTGRKYYTNVISCVFTHNPEVSQHNKVRAWTSNIDDQFTDDIDRFTLMMQSIKDSMNKILEKGHDTDDPIYLELVEDYNRAKMIVNTALDKRKAIRQSQGFHNVDIMSRLNNMLTKLKAKKRLGKIFSIRALESTQKGYPHVHMLIIFENPLECFVSWEKDKLTGKKRKVYRVQNKSMIQDVWDSHVDVRAVADSEAVYNYITKDVTKQFDISKYTVAMVERMEKEDPEAYKRYRQSLRSSALNWFFGKRALAIGKMQDWLFDSINTRLTQMFSEASMRNEMISDARSKGYIFVGLRNVIVKGDPPDKLDYSVKLTPDSLIHLCETIRVPRSALDVQKIREHDAFGTDYPYCTFEKYVMRYFGIPDFKLGKFQSGLRYEGMVC